MEYECSPQSIFILTGTNSASSCCSSVSINMGGFVCDKTVFGFIVFFFVFSVLANCHLNCHFCLQCGDPFKDEDIVVLNGTKEEVQKLREKMQEKRAKAKTKVSFFSTYS